MEITKTARAGSLESSDIFIVVEPNKNKGINIELDSIVLKQYGEQIKKVMYETLQELGIKDIKIIARDRGALDYTIKARLETAIKRAI
jgi:citrate lyase subunit gamma (acyl carrier protein)